MVKKSMKEKKSELVDDEPVPGEVSEELQEFITELEDAAAIDEDRLEEGLRDSVDLYRRVAQRVALEQSRRDAAKQWYKTVEARIDAAIRRGAKESGEKVTEKEIESRKTLHSDYQGAFATLLGIERGCKELEALERAFSNRLSALKHLASLWIAGYYGEASASSSSAKTKEALAENTKRNYRTRG